MKKKLSIMLVMMLILISSITVYAESLETPHEKLVTNGYTTFIIESNGDVKGFGRNAKGEVGNGTTVDQLTPVPIEGLSNIHEIIPNNYGYGHFFAIDNDGNAYSWGYNGSGVLGQGSGTFNVPTLIPNLPRVKKIVLGEYTSYAITTDGDVYATGANANGQVGNGTKITQMTFTKLNNLPNIRDIVTKNNVVYILTETGDVYTCVNAIPTLIAGLVQLQVDAIITNGQTTFAICNDGQELYSWGAGWSGQTGNNHEDPKVPTRIWIISDLDESIDYFTIEGATAFALMSDKTLYGWGENSSNQLGQGGTFDKGTPIIIPNIPKIKQFVFNGSTGLALGVDNNIYGWGTNSYGEAGIGYTGRTRYAEKLNISNIEQIYNGGNSMYARDSDGVMYSWGTNNKGQLGLGSTSRKLIPTVMSGDMIDLTRVKDTVYAVDSENKIYGWGANEYGQLGNGLASIETSPLIISKGMLTTTKGTGDVDGVIPIVGTINALTLSVTHPANISYSIDPNVADGFYCPNINIQNNSKVPVKVHIESFRASAENGLVFQDVHPDDYDWDKLNKQESKSLIALGLQYLDGNEWRNMQSIFNEPVYAIDIDDTYAGGLAKGSSGGFELSGSHGLAFDGSYIAKHELVFVFTLE
jgi:alpha-tubulin suppressor-like RCC1 family protein